MTFWFSKNSSYDPIIACIEKNIACIEKKDLYKDYPGMFNFKSAAHSIAECKWRFFRNKKTDHRDINCFDSRSSINSFLEDFKEITFEEAIKIVSTNILIECFELTPMDIVRLRTG